MDFPPQIPILSRTPLSFPFPNLHKSPPSKFLCLKRSKTQLNVPIKLAAPLTIKSSSTRILLFFNDFFISRDIVLPDPSLYKTLKKMDFCLVNEDFSLILIFHERSESSIDYSFEAFFYSDSLKEYESNLEKPSYKLNNFIGIELKQAKIYLLTFESTLIVYSFNNRKELIKIKEIELFLEIRQNFQGFFLSKNSDDIIIQMSGEIFIINMINSHKTQLPFENNERIHVFLRKNEDFLILLSTFILYTTPKSSFIINLPNQDFKIDKLLTFNEFFLITLSKNLRFSLYKLTENPLSTDFLQYQDHLTLNEGFKALYCSQNLTILLETSQKAINNDFSFDLLQITMESPETILLQSYQSENNEKIAYLMKTYSFDEKNLLKKRWEISFKKDSEILEILLNIPDLEYLEKAYESFNNSLISDTLDRFFLKKSLLLKEKVLYFGLNDINIASCLEFYWKYLENLYYLSNIQTFLQLRDSFLEENLISLKDFKAFIIRNPLELFIEYIENNKIRSAKILLQQNPHLFFHNYWKLFEKEGFLSKNPERILILLPKSLAKICQNQDFSDFIWNLYQQIPSKSLFYNVFLRNFSEIPHDILSKIEKRAFQQENPLMKLFLSETNDLISYKTYNEILEISYFLTKNPSYSIKILEYGYYKGGWELLKPEILLYKLLELLVLSPGTEEIDLYEFKALEPEDRLASLIEANLKDSSFIELLKNQIKGFYEEFAEEKAFWRDLKAFSLRKSCSVKVFLELLKLKIGLELEKPHSNKGEILAFVESFKELRLFCEHHRELFEMASLLKASNLFLLEKELISEYEKTSEIAQILYTFSINPSISTISQIATTEEAIRISEELLQNHFLNRKKNDHVPLSKGLEVVFLDSLKALIKVLFYLRDLYFPFIKDNTIYQILCKKLLDNSKFSLLRELIEKEKLFKKLDIEIFEGLISENMENSYQSAPEVARIESFITKSLDLLPGDSSVKKAERALWRSVLILQRFELTFTVKTLRNCNRIVFFHSIVKELDLISYFKIKEFPFMELIKGFYEFDYINNREWHDSEEFNEILKEFGYILIKAGEFEKVKELIELLDKRESKWTETLSSKIIEANILSNEEICFYSKLSLLRCKESQALTRVLARREEEIRAFSNSNTAFDFFLSERLILEKKNTFNEKAFYNFYRKLLRSKDIEKMTFFLQDLTLNPARAFYQFGIAPEKEIVSIEIFEEMVFTLLKSGFFELERLIIGLLLSLSIRNDLIPLKNIEEINIFLKDPYKFDSIPEISDFQGKNDNNLIITLKPAPKTLILIEKLQQMLIVIRKMPLIENFLKTPLEIKTFIFDNAFRNEKLISILFESHDLELFQQFQSLLQTSKFNIRDLLLSKLVKGVNDLEEDSLKTDFDRFLGLGKVSENELQKIYTKIRFQSIGHVKLFTEVFLKELDNRKLISFVILAEILDGKFEELIRPFIPDILVLVLRNRDNDDKKNKINQFYENLDESNIFLIAKTVEILAGGFNFEEKIYTRFLMKKLKQWDYLYNETQNDASYNDLMLELQKFVAIFPRIKTFKRMQKIALFIAKKQGVKNLDLFEIYSTLYSFVYDAILTKFPNKALNSFLLNVPSLIVLKSKLLCVFSSKEKYRKTSKLIDLVMKFKEETLYEEETLFEILDLVVKGERNQEYEEEIALYLDIDSFERYLIQKIRMAICEISDYEQSNNITPMILTQKIFSKDNSILKDNRVLYKASLLLKSTQNFLKNTKFFKIDVIELHKRILGFIDNEIMNQDDMKLQSKLLIVWLVKTEFELNNNQINEFLGDIALRILSENYEFNEMLKGGEKIKDFNIENEKELIFLINWIQIKSFEKNQFIIEYLFERKKHEVILILLNIGVLNNNIFKNIKIDDKDDWFVVILNNNYIDNNENIKKIHEFFDFNDKNNISNHLFKFLLSKGILAKFINTELYSQIFNYFYECLQQYSCEIYIDNDKNKKLFAKKFIKPEEILINYKDLQYFDNESWFGKSFFEVYIDNILGLIKTNEYYDAAKLNYYFINKNSNFSSIGSMLMELKKYLENVSREVEMEDDMGRSLKNCIEILKKLIK